MGSHLVSGVLTVFALIRNIIFLSQCNVIVSRST